MLDSSAPAIVAGDRLFGRTAPRTWMNRHHPAVLIVQAQMKRYRLPFFTRLHEVLRSDGVRLTVAYSAPRDAGAGHQDDAELAPPVGEKVRGYWLAGDRLLFQPLIRRIHDAQLVVLEQAGKHLLNLPLLLTS